MAVVDVGESLCGICRGHGWSYGVYWQFDRRNPRLMVLCDSYYHEQIGTVIEKTVSQVHFVGQGTIGVAAVSGKHQWIYSDNFLEGNSEWQRHFLAGIKTIVIVSLPSFGVVQFGSTEKISESLEFTDQVRHLLCQGENMTGHPIPGHIYRTQRAHDRCESFASSIYSGYTDASPAVINSFHDVITKELQNNSTNSFQSSNCSHDASISVNNPFMKIPSVNSITSFQFTSHCLVSGSQTRGLSPPNNNIQSGYTFSRNSFSTNLDTNIWAKEVSTLHLPQQRLLPENPFHYSCMDSISLSSSNSSSIASQLPGNFLSFPQVSSPENAALFQFKEDQTNYQIDLCDQRSAASLLTKDNITSVETDSISCSPSTDLASKPAEIPVTTACDWKECSSNCPTPFLLDNDLFEGMELDLSPRILRQDCWDDMIMPPGDGGCSSDLSIDVSDCMPSFEQLLESVVGECTNLSSSTANSSIPTSLKFDPQVSRFSQVDCSEGNTKLAPLAELSLEKIIQQYSKEALPKSHASCSMNAGSVVTEKPEENVKFVRKRARPGESTRPRPKDRQQIQDRVKELREMVPNGAKCSIDSLLDRTIKHMLFLQSVTKFAGQLKQTDEPKMIGNESGVVLRDNLGGNATGGGATWAYEVAGQTMVCPILVEDLTPPGQMLIEMLCEERGFFLEIADIIRGFGLTILKGVMEIREHKIWAHFVVEANRDVTRMDIFLSLVQLLQQTSSLRTKEQPSKALDKDTPSTFPNHQQPQLPAPIRL